jgi:hypothetical protein
MAIFTRDDDSSAILDCEIGTAPPGRNATPPGRRCPVHSEGVQTEGGLGGELQDGGGLWGGQERLVATGGALGGGGSTGEKGGGGAQK